MNIDWSAKGLKNRYFYILVKMYLEDIATARQYGDYKRGDRLRKELDAFSGNLFKLELYEDRAIAKSKGYTLVSVNIPSGFITIEGRT